MKTALDKHVGGQYNRQCCGAIAQLGERLNGIQEVRGSTPLSSTKKKASRFYREAFLFLNQCFRWPIDAQKEPGKLPHHPRCDGSRRRLPLHGGRWFNLQGPTAAAFRAFPWGRFHGYFGFLFDKGKHLHFNPGFSYVVTLQTKGSTLLKDL